MNYSRSRLFLLSLVISFIIQGCQSNGKQDPASRFDHLLHQEPYAIYTDSIRSFPKNGELYFQRALLLSQNNHHEAATADYKASWHLQQTPEAALEYVNNLLLTNKVSEAISILQEGARRFPENTGFSRRLGEIYVQTGRSGKALEQYDALLAADSANFETWYDKAMLLVSLNDTLEAIKCLQRSFSLMPISYSGLALANLYTSRKDPRALAVCDKLLSNDTAEVLTDPLYMKGIFYTETNQDEKALLQFDECIKRDWKMTDAYIEKGIIYFERKDYPKAMEIFNLAATVSNTNADTYYWIARCNEAQGKTKEAIENYERALALDGSITEAKIRLKKLNN